LLSYVYFSAPASKSMRLDEKSDENSDIEVDD